MSIITDSKEDIEIMMDRDKMQPHKHEATMRQTIQEFFFKLKIFNSRDQHPFKLVSNTFKFCYLAWTQIFSESGSILVPVGR